MILHAVFRMLVAYAAYNGGGGVYQVVDETVLIQAARIMNERVDY